jgi:D-alanine--poly(phosphoribitol) ligase subunit 2
MSDNINSKVYDIICQEIENHNNNQDKKVDLVEGRSTRLFGGGAPLDSIQLVTLLVNIEEAIDDQLGFFITIADERAMSRRVSPFASVGLLTDYITEILSEEKA